MAESKKGAFLLILAAAVGGIGFVWLKELLDSGFTSLQCLWGRYAVANVVMGICYIIKRREISKEAFKKGVILGIILFVFFYVMIEGLRLTTPSVNAFLTNTQSVMVPIMAFLLFRKKPSKKVCVAAAMTVLGAWMLSFNGEADFSLGAIISLLSAAIFSLQMVLLGGFVKDCDPMDLTAADGFTVFVLSYIVMFFKDGYPKITGGDVVPLVGLGFFCTFLYFVLLSMGQKNTSETTAGIIITSESVFAAIFSFLLYGERMSILAFFGCAIIFAAILLTECDFKNLKLLTRVKK